MIYAFCHRKFRYLKIGKQNDRIMKIYGIEKKYYVLSFIVSFFVTIIGVFIAIGIADTDKQRLDVQVDSIQYNEKTIEEILHIREIRKKAILLDSVFLNMPEMALIAILIKKGTMISTDSIAEEYLKNRPYYDKLFPSDKKMKSRYIAFDKKNQKKHPL